MNKRYENALRQIKLASDEILGQIENGISDEFYNDDIPVPTQEEQVQLIYKEVLGNHHVEQGYSIAVKHNEVTLTTKQWMLNEITKIVEAYGLN